MSIDFNRTQAKLPSFRQLSSFSLFLFALLFLASCHPELIIDPDIEENIIDEKQETEEETTKQPKLVKFGFRVKDNPVSLNADILVRVESKDIQLRIPYYTDVSKLVPYFELENKGYIYIGQKEIIGSKSVLDFSEQVQFTLKDQESFSKNYNIQLINFTGLPILRVNTSERKPILSKTEYLPGEFILDGNGRTQQFLRGGTSIRGRGNTTWGMPKKPFRIKLDDKPDHVLGMPRNHNWALLQNYADKTQLRNHTALFMGSISNLDWTPRSEFVELIVNEEYLGTYELIETIRINNERVNVGDEGFILEIDAESRMTPEDNWFRTDANHILFNIKKPKIASNDPQTAYIQNIINTAEKALYSPNFRDPKKGYQRYLDKASFIDWYLINEITKNNDAAFISSCFLNYKPGGKLKMGPIWDFDIAFGNTDYGGSNSSYEGFYIKDTGWSRRLFQDPNFVNEVKERFKYFNSRKLDIIHHINTQAEYLKWSNIENNNKWGTLYQYTWPNSLIWGSYDNELIQLKNWIMQRFDWLESAFEEL